MKIHNAELEAAHTILSEYTGLITAELTKEMLQAALTVRKQRKADKRERQRKDTPKVNTWWGCDISALSLDDLSEVKKSVAHYTTGTPFERMAYKQICDEISGRKEKDKQVVESVGGTDGFRPGTITAKSSPFKAHEWDGTFSVGDYETRAGDKQTIVSTAGQYPFPLISQNGVSYTANGRYDLGGEMQGDLIRPWPKGEQ